MKVPFVGPSYTSRSTNLNAQRTLNWYPEFTPDGKSAVALLPRPGMVQFADMSSSWPIRGGIEINDTAYVVFGAVFYSVSSTGTVTTLGMLNTFDGQVGMTTSGTQIIITDGTYGYLFTISGAAFAAISDVDFTGSVAAAFLDGLFIVVDPSSGRMRCSGTYDGATWDVLDFATAESSADNTVRVIADHDELVVFGKRSTEFWFNDGGANFPFSKVQGATLTRGCAAAFSVERVDNSVFWLGEDLVVYRLNGRAPVRVSTHAVEQAIQGYDTTSDAAAFTYDWDGHKFYVLTFPTANATWVYDVATQMWHEAGTFGTGQWAVNVALRIGAYVVVGSTLTGKLYYLSNDAYDDAGTAIERVRAAQVIHQDQKRLFHNRLEIDFEGGVGLLSGQGSAPIAMLSWSDDGGHNFGNEVYATLGATGEYGSRAIWNRLGSSRNRVYKVRITDPVKAVLIGARGDGAAGAS